jgi:hypothetical protein
MSQDDVNAAIEQLRTALDEYKAQGNPEASHLFHLRVGGSPFHVKQAEYLEALGAAVYCELRLLFRAWRAARDMGCTPSTTHIDELLDERTATPKRFDRIKLPE